MTLSRITDAVAAHYSSIDQRSAAQAVELVRALRDRLYEMTRRLAWLERQGVTGTNGRASAIRCEAAALRLDISEAQFFIDRLPLPERRRAAARNGEVPCLGTDLLEVSA